MNWSDFDPYLRPESLRDNPSTFEIARVVLQETGTNHHTIRRAVLYFKGTDKGLVLSLTHRRVLAAYFGDSVDACVGKEVTLQAVRVQEDGVERYKLDLAPAIEGSVRASDAYQQVLAYALQIGRTPEAARHALRLAQGDSRVACAFLEEE